VANANLELIIAARNQADAELQKLNRALRDAGSTTRVTATNAGELMKQLRGAERAEKEIAKLDRYIAKLGDSANGSTSRLGGLWGQLSRLGSLKVGSIDLGGALKFGAVGLGLQQFLDKAGGAIEAASSLSETVSKSGVVFGSWAGQVAAFGDSAAFAIGQSKQQAMEAAATFGNLFTASGMARGEAARLSVNIVKLASDLASFNNLNPGEVLEKLRSGLVGETEPLRSLGINISEATTKAKALELGLGALNGELTDGEKIQARYALILQQSANAQGDFARTSDGLANSQRIVAAGMADISAEIGSALMPAAQGVTSAFARHLPEAMEATREAAGALKIWLEAIGDLLGLIGREGGNAAEAIGKVGTAAANAAVPTGTYAELLKTTNEQLERMYTTENLNLTQQGKRRLEAQQAAKDMQAYLGTLKRWDRGAEGNVETSEQLERQAKAEKELAAAAEARLQAQVKQSSAPGVGLLPDQLEAQLEAPRREKAAQEAAAEAAKLAKEAARDAASAIQKGIAETARAATEAVQELQKAMKGLADTPVLGTAAMNERQEQLQTAIAESEYKIEQMRRGELPRTGLGAESRKLAKLQQDLEYARKEEAATLDPIRRKITAASTITPPEMAGSDILAAIANIKPSLAAAQAVQNQTSVTNHISVKVDASGRVQVSGAGSEGMGGQVAAAIAGVLDELFGPGGSVSSGGAAPQLAGSGG
jgi:hypothetical protein